jgi:uncharacterized membrane protein HdeD (DUF308 family)
MKTQSKSTKIAMAAVNILLIIAGIFLIFNLYSIVVFFCVAMLIFGAMEIGKFIADKQKRNGWDVLSGMVHILFGSLILFGDPHTKILALFSIEIYISIWIMIAGILRICASLHIKKMNLKGWVWTLTGGVLLILCSIFCFIFPLISAISMIRIAGIFTSAAFIVIGLIGLINAFSGGGGNTPKAA